MNEKSGLATAPVILPHRCVSEGQPKGVESFLWFRAQEQAPRFARRALFVEERQSEPGRDVYLSGLKRAKTET